jgi:hypothetical protein
MTLKMKYKKSSEMSKINGTYFIGYDKIYASGLKKLPVENISGSYSLFRDQLWNISAWPARE